MTRISSSRFDDFVLTLKSLARRLPVEGMADAAAALQNLIAEDDWLPAPYRVPRGDRYCQYLLARTCDPEMSVVSFVWGPGQSTPIHNHGVWGLVGVLQGVECEQRYSLVGDTLKKFGEEKLLEAGSVSRIVPDKDIHRVRNGLSDGVSISIHVYGADIGTLERTAYDEQGTQRLFVSGYEEVIE